MTLYFVRHADKAKGDYGSSNLPHLNQPISKYGNKQANALYKYLQNKKIDEIYVSEYIRTVSDNLTTPPAGAEIHTDSLTKSSWSK